MIALIQQSNNSGFDNHVPVDRTFATGACHQASAANNTEHLTCTRGDDQTFHFFAVHALPFEHISHLG